MNDNFTDLRNEITELVTEWEMKLLELPEKTLSNNRNRQNRTIKQILGHLVDSAVNNHHRIVRLQYNTDLEFPDYRQDNDIWIRIQNYQNEDWKNLITLWKYYNIHLNHVIKNVNSDCLKNTWKDFEGTVETLESIITGYLSHLNLHIDEIKELIY